MRFDLDGPGIIEIKWEKVKGIRSDRTFEILLQSGQVLLSNLDSLFFSKHQIGVDHIIEIYPIRNRLLKRLNGNFSTGLNYTKSSEIFNLILTESLTIVFQNWSLVYTPTL